MKTTIKIAVIAALAATADVSVAAAAGPATALAGSAGVLKVDSQVEQVQRRVVRRRPIVRGGPRRVVRPYRGGRRWARGYPGPRYYPYYGYPYYYRDGGAAVAAGIIGLALGATLGAAASNSYYGEPYVYDAPPASAQSPSGCYTGAGNRLECPPY